MFNFSFVDILATTIGVLIFIMVLVIINSVNRVTTDDVTQQTQQDEDKIGELRSKLMKLLAAIKQIEAQLGNDQNVKTSPKLDFNAEKKKYDELKKQKDELKKKVADLSAALQKYLNRFAQKEQEFQNVQNLPGIKKTKVIFRVPEERRTTKKPILFECADNRIHFLAGGGNFNKKTYTVTSSPQLLIISRKKRAKGFSYRQIMSPRSNFTASINKFSPKNYYAIFLVRPDSYKFYRKIRSLFWNRHWDCIWEGQLPGKTFLIPRNAKGGSDTIL